MGAEKPNTDEVKQTTKITTKTSPSPPTPAVSTTIESPTAETSPAPSDQPTEAKKPQTKSRKSRKHSKKEKRPRTKGQKTLLIVIILLAIGLATAVGVIFWLSFQNNYEQNKVDHVEFPDPIYSTLTGLEIDNESLNSSPTYCVQIPNGTDGGRPQAGLTQAAVVFEAIAESGITRFAAVFQNPTTSAIGPIRSLRPYYLDWDTPFDCTIVHAGGSTEAIAALRQGGQRDLNENYTYMWREQGTGRSWNNLFTSPAYLAQFNKDRGYDTSTVRAFPHLTPDETTEAVDSATTCTTDEDGSEVCITEFVENVIINFGAIPTYNTTYTYNPETNTYYRAYANGESHLVYDCPANLDQPNTKSDCGEPIQVNPSVVVAMVVQEGKMSDQYHEDISTTGSGNAIVFQNGQAIEATWTKLTQQDQIIFRDTNGEQIRFTPGQLWIAAVPQYGSVQY